jgi:hypothetical protein
MTKPPHALEGWTDHAREEYGTFWGEPPSDQEMRQLLRLWERHSAEAFLNRKGRWQVKVEVISKRSRRRLWLIAGEHDGKWLLWTVFEVG